MQSCRHRRDDIACFDAEVKSREPEVAGQTRGGRQQLGHRLEHAARELGALSTAAFDATDLERLEHFFDELRTPVDHVPVTASGLYYARRADTPVIVDIDPGRTFLGTPSPATPDFAYTRGQSLTGRNRT